MGSILTATYRYNNLIVNFIEGGTKMSESVKEIISKLIEFIEEKGLDAYLVPSSDNHQSEYVGDFFKARDM